MVIADVATLQTLPQEEFTSGIAEIIKHGLIADSSLLEKVENTNWHHEFGTLYTSLFKIQTLVAQTIQVKIAVIQEDPFDYGQRYILNFGHTFAHAIEQVSGYVVRHGEAVAMGMVAAAKLSVRLGYCSADDSERVERILKNVGLPTRIPKNLDVELLYKAMENDKKRLGKIVRFVILSRIGRAFVTDDIGKLEALTTLEEMIE